MNLKDKIINQAQYRFYKDGFNKISIDELSRELNVSKNTIYKHFRNKDDILWSAIETTINNASITISGILRSEENSVIKLTSILKLVIETISIKFSEKFINDLRIHKPELWDRIDLIRQELMNKNLSRIIKQGIREKLIKNYPEELILTMMVSSLRSVVNPEFIMSMNYSRTDIINYAFEILTNGILTDKGKSFYNKIKIKK